MMEVFSIRFGDEKATVVRTNVGQYKCRIPTRYDKMGNEYVEYVEKTKKGWVYNATKKEDPEFQEKIWLELDGGIGWEDKNGLQQMYSSKFNPYGKPKNHLEVIAQLIAYVKREVAAYEKLNLPTAELLKKREDYLNAIIKLIGYSSVDKVKYGTDFIEPICSLRDVAMLLTGYQDLTPYGYKVGVVKGNSVCCSTVATKEERDDAVDKGRYVEYDANDIGVIRQERIDDFETKRSFYNAYCRDMKKVLPASEWKLYSEMLERTAKLIMGLNYDLLDEADRKPLPAETGIVVEGLGAACPVVDRTRQEVGEAEKIIDAFINSPDFKRVCEIEDWFVLRNLDHVEETIEEESKDARTREALSEQFEDLRKGIEAERAKRKIDTSSWRRGQKVVALEDDYSIYNKYVPNIGNEEMDDEVK